MSLSACSSLPGTGLFKGDSGGGRTQHAAGGEVTAITSDPDYAALTPVERATLWAKYYERSSSDPEVVEAFSRSLREIGSVERAISITASATEEFPTHPGVLVEYAKSLIANGRSFEAIRPLEKALEVTAFQDWRILSVYGVALDSIEQHHAAQKAYHQALALSPQNPKILNNLGLSLAFAGNRDAAENRLRDAAGQQGATSQIRQNLSLVLAIDGNLEEAERLTRSDLPPEIAKKNIEYYRSLHEKPDYWSVSSGSDRTEMPDFESPAGLPGTDAPDDVTFDRPPPDIGALGKAVPGVSSPAREVNSEPVSEASGSNQPTNALPTNARPTRAPLNPAVSSPVDAFSSSGSVNADQPAVTELPEVKKQLPEGEQGAAAKAQRTGIYDGGTLDRRPGNKNRW